MRLAAALALLVIVPRQGARADESPFLEHARLTKSTDGPRLVRLARATIEAVVRDGDLEPEIPVPVRARKPAHFGLFVTLVGDRQIRGCYGAMEPMGRSLEDLVVEAAVGAARWDPRNAPVTERELDRVQVILSFVGPTVPVVSMSEVDPERDGLLVRSGDRNALLLPGEAKTARWQLKKTLRLAGIRPKEPREMFRFRTVTVYERGR